MRFYLSTALPPSATSTSMPQFIFFNQASCSTNCSRDSFTFHLRAL